MPGRSEAFGSSVDADVPDLEPWPVVGLDLDDPGAAAEDVEVVGAVPLGQGLAVGAGAVPQALDAAEGEGVLDRELAAVLAVLGRAAGLAPVDGGTDATLGAEEPPRSPRAAAALAVLLGLGVGDARSCVCGARLGFRIGCRVLTLAIGDLHLGYEAALQAEHVSIPRFQLKPMVEKLEKLLARYNPERIIINGDMKHEFSKNKGQEWDEVETILDMLAYRETIIVRGNHDNYLQTMLSRQNIRMMEYFTLPASHITFLHGHKMFETEGMKVFSHEHPVLRLRDDVGAQVTLPCFLYDEASQIVIMPAFSPLASGTNVISPESTFMSKELQKLNLENARIFTISNGIIEFGRVGDLRKISEENIF